MKVNETLKTDRTGTAIVELAVSRGGWIFREQETADHGIDAHIESVIDRKATGRLIAVQIKSGKSYFGNSTDSGYIFRGDAEHLEYWINHSLPVLLFLVDTENERVYWEYVVDSNVESTGKGWKIEVPRSQRLEPRHFKQLEQIATHLRYFPQNLVDDIIGTEISLLRKKRFFPEYDRVVEAKQLGSALLKGHLAAGSDGVRARALAWCARILARTDNGDLAADFLERSQVLECTEEAEIAKAFLISHRQNVTEAVSILEKLKSPLARTATLMINAFENGESAALQWLDDSGYSAPQFDSEGRFFVINLHLSSGDWKGAIAFQTSIKLEDQERTPALYRIMAVTKLLEPVPDDLRHVVVNGVPLEAAEFPIEGEASSVEALRESLERFKAAAASYSALGLEEALRQVKEYAIWLRLVDPMNHEEGQRMLRERLREMGTALGLVPLALQFGVTLNLELVERTIDYQIHSEGSARIDAAKARFALALTKESPQEAVAYVEKYHSDLCEYFTVGAVCSLQVQLWAKAGSLEKADEFLLQAIAGGISKGQEQGLRRMISEAEGSDPAKERREQFEATNNFEDLLHLVEALALQEDGDGLCKYGEILFKRAGSLRNAEQLSGALLMENRAEHLVELFAPLTELREQSSTLQLRYCWALFREGKLAQAQSELKDSASNWDSSNYRTLQVNLAISLGHWAAIPALIARDYEARDMRSVKELLTAAQLGLGTGSVHVKELLRTAVEKAGDDAGVLASAYLMASKAGWEDEEEIAGWLHRASKLSKDEDGSPLQMVGLKDVVEMRPAWEERESNAWKLVSRGETPQFLAAEHLNKSLVELTIIPFLSNLRQKDPRKRFNISAFAGNRQSYEISKGSKVGFEPTALLTLASLDLLEETLQAFDSVYIAHATLAWLFEEKQRVAFHQPSQIRKARQLLELIPNSSIEQLAPSAVPSTELVAHVGKDLAMMIAEAKSVKEGADHQRMVVRPSPVYAVGSLMEEEADITDFEDVICSCGAVVEKMRDEGCITAETARKACSFLAIRERRWPHEPELAEGAWLYLDGLAVNYLRAVGVLGELAPAGFKVVVSPDHIAEANQLLSYDSLIGKVDSMIDQVRDIIKSGVESGTILFDRQTDVPNGSDAEFQEHPCYGAVGMASRCDAVVTDDRFLNKFRSISNAKNSAPIATSLDIIDYLYKRNLINSERVLECRTQLRRAGYLFMPIDSGELLAQLIQSPVKDGRVRETAELRAIRESFFRAKMSGWLEIPGEVNWLNSAMSVLRDVLGLLWMESEADEVKTRARSTWIANLLEIRGWRGRSGSDTELASGDELNAVNISTILAPNQPMSREQRLVYWSWLEENVLEPMKESAPEAFAAMIELVKNQITDATDKGVEQFMAEQLNEI